MPVIGLLHSYNSGGKDMNVKEALSILNTHFFIHHCTLQTRAQNFLTTPLVFVIQILSQ
jgi:hypothetical protein